MQFSRLIHAALWIVLVWPLPGKSEELVPVVLPSTAPQFLNYEDSVRLALHQNVDLLSIRGQESSLKYQSNQALSPNNPVLSWTKADVPGFSLNNEAVQTIYQLSWTLGFPGKAFAQSAALRHQAEAAEENALGQEINLMSMLSNNFVAFTTNLSFYNFLLDEQKRDKDLKRLLEKKFSASQAAKVDILNAEVMTQQIAQNILANRNDYTILLTQFRQIIRRPQDANLFPKIPEKITIPPLKQTFEQLVPIMLKNNHAVRAAERNVESSAATLNNARLQALPDFQLTAGINRWKPANAPIPGQSRDYTVGIGISVPIFFPLNELVGIHAAEQTRSATESQLNSQQLQAISALQTAYASLQATLKDLDASERLVVPAAKSAYDLTLLTYSLGKADYFMLNQSRKTWHDAMRDMLTKRQNAAQLYNQLIALVGCDFAKTEGTYVCN